MAVAALALTSCDSYLDEKPQDFADDSAFYNSADALKYAVNDFYSMLPANDSFWGGTYATDVNSDNQMASSANSLLYKGDKRTPMMGSGQPWYFGRMRGINYFISKVVGHEESMTGSPILIQHYLGEAYFFRAYDNFSRLTQLGDVPLLTELLPDEPAILTEMSKRRPRNEVARAIIADLDIAIEKLLETAPEAGRITRDAALMLKARVALFEATWERYHANTCFVPGNSKWPGKDMWKDFKWQAGSAEAEINWFLDRAINAADSIASHRNLNNDYQAMFNNFTTQFGDNDEVILARYYKDGVLSHSCSALLKGGGGCNVTRAAVNTFLMENGLPIYADNSGYQGDETSYIEFQGRDSRLTGSVRAAGSYITAHLNEETGKYEPDTIYYYRPFLESAGREKATTGYELQKWLTEDVDQRRQYHCETATPIFRAAEAYLVYLEAYYERYGNLGGNCDKYWRALRRRAGVDEDYNKTIAATRLSEENDLAVWSRGKEVSPTLYNIRRERRCEFIAEGMRLNDLKRWRALDMMVDYQPEGFNLWGGPIKDMYAANKITSDIVSQASDGNYVRPLRINTTSAAYQGYNFPKPHYLEPIPISEFLLTVDPEGTGSTIYQNPGWPTRVDGIADYNYDCD